jgi:prepilin-type N-terminal cleavage/methylation domain-containing protein
MSILRHNGCQKASLGFTLIEAIVAMAIIGIAALPIMLLISESLNQLTRAANASSHAAAMESVIAMLDPMNPMTTPTGKMDMGSFSFTWESAVIVPPNDTVQVGAGLAGHSIGFYDVQIEIYREERPWFSFSARKTGYERISGIGPIADTD